MNYLQLPGTLLKPSRIVLGTGSMGSAVSEADSFAILDAYVEGGGNSLDSANCYAGWLPDGEGASERTIGNWLKERGNRGTVHVMTKGGHPRFESIDVPRLNPEAITADLEQSLDRLQTDFVDYYWLHRDDEDVPVNEVVDVLNEHIKDGMVDAIGVSNWSTARVRLANDYAVANSLTGFTASQIGWSLADRSRGGFSGMKYMDDETMEFHRKTSLPVFAYSSQAKGFFSGAYSIDGELPDRKSASAVEKFYFGPENFDRLDRTLEMAAERGLSGNDVAIGYILSHPFPTYAIVGPNAVEQIVSSCGAGDLAFSPEDVAFLERDE